MKKKIFSAMLLFAFTLGATSTFVSCKDYDDDINGLRDDIDALKSADELLAKTADMQAAIAAAQSSLESKIADAANTAAAASKANADDIAEMKSDVEKAVENANKAIEEVKKLSGAEEDIKALKEDVKKAQETADAAKTELDKIKGDSYAEGLTLSSINAQVKAIQDLLTGSDGKTVDLGEMSDKVNELDAQLVSIIGEYTTMVTSVHFWLNKEVNYGKGEQPETAALDFKYITGEVNNTWPAKDAADKQLTFSSKNTDIAYQTDWVVLRVSPTNAVLKADNISLINSQGKELEEVEVASVERYNQLATTTTRAAVDGNGLWKVTFKLKDGVDPDDFKAATQQTVDNEEHYVAYAAAVQNTKSDSTRRVISDYLATVTSTAAAALTYEDFDITDSEGEKHNVTTVRNRYDKKTYAEYRWVYNGQHLTRIDNSNYYRTDCKVVNGFGVLTETNRNLARYNNGKVTVGGVSYPKSGTIAVPSTGLSTIETDKDKFHYIANAKDADEAPTTTQPYNDNRNNAETFKYVPVLLNQDIKISFNDFTSGENIKAFYVTLDYNFVEAESNPSELNAWNSYTYTNVGKTGTPAKLFEGTEGVIQINSLANYDKKNEIIGFRVYAINQDGTLVDPDGRAFYVEVGTTDRKEDATLAATDVLADRKKPSTGFIALNDALNFNSYDETLSNLTWTVLDANGNEVEGATVNVTYYTEQNDNKTTTDKTKAKYMKVQLDDATKFTDGGTFTLKAQLHKESAAGNNQLVRNVSVDITKVMPTAAPALALATGMDAEYNFLTPETNYKYTDGKDARITDFATVYTNTYEAASGNYFTFTVADDDKADKYSVVKASVSGAKYTVKDKVINDFAKVTTTYTYVNVSSKDNQPDLTFDGETIDKFGFLSWTASQSFAWADGKTPEIVNSVMTPVNAETLIGTNTKLTPFNNNYAALLKVPYFTDSYTDSKGKTFTYALTQDEDGEKASAYFTVRLVDKSNENAFITTDSEGNKVAHDSFLFEPIANVGQATDHTEYLQIYITDCFGQMAKFTVPVSLKR